MKKVEIYTDGACSGNPGVGGWGCVLIFNEHQKKLFGAVESTTNNRMELWAIIQGLKALKMPCEVNVYSDSAYVINSINAGWLQQWLLSGWKTTSKKPVLNVDLWEQLLTLMEQHKIIWCKVKGHSDNVYNNMCDTLATTAIKNYKKPAH